MATISPHRPTQTRRSVRPRERNPVRRAVQLLTALIDCLPDNVGVRELAHRLGMPPSTVHRALELMGRENLVNTNNGSGRYQLGLEFIRLAWQTVAALPLPGVAIPRMTELVHASGETAVLSLYDRVRRQKIIVATVESEHQLRYVLQLYQWLPVHAGATGLAILAFLPEVDRDAIVRGQRLASVTARTITDPEALGRELALVRRRGYAVTKGQRIAGAVGIAAPLRNHHGEVVGSVGLTIPEQRFVSNAQIRLGRLVVKCAEQVSKDLGSKAGT